MATIKDVAALDGVSITTVSMVLNRTDDKIAAKTKEKVFLARRSMVTMPIRLLELSLVRRAT